jgi:glutamate N-acetyltransferase/amino-acid N-acetyltransferase
VSVTAPLGFRAAGVAAGLKAAGARDVAVVINDGPSRAAAAVFTANRVQAAPVLWTRQVVRGGRVRAVALNSGGANACTGPDGFADTHEIAERLAAELSDSAGEIAVCSTGLIGERLPMDKLLPGLQAAAAEASRSGGPAAADAIRTTDSVVKIAFRRGAAQRNTGDGPPDAADVARSGADAARAGYTIGGMAKGAGMLAPALATMLCVLSTDADLTAAELDAALRGATAVTFDRLDTDGCMSTNDTVLLLASGASGARPDPAEFAGQLTAVCADLARQLQLDAEGAGKAIAIEVVGAASERDAVTVGRAVARSALLKCAIAGEDPNWGRVLSAVGTTDAEFEPDQLNVAINGIWVCRNGYAADDRSKVDLGPRDVTITIDLSAGPDSATVATTDLTVGYVHENTAYST